LAAGVVEPAIINSRVKALGAIREELPEDMDDLATAYARANNLRDAELGTDVDAGALAGVRADLLSAVNAAQGQVEAALGATDYTAAVKALAALRAPIDTFFDQVKVMADDAAEREQNLKLLNAFVGVFAQVADFGKMAKKK
jgi:glycyl-tRNA synthetase beta chain